MTQQPFLRALDAPPGEAVVLDPGLIERAIAASRQSPRRRVILPLYLSPADPYQRMLNAAQPGSYIRPHRHRDPPKGETVVLLRGSVRFLTFREDGAVARSAAVFEAKTGPYDERVDKDFAPWVPVEGGPEARAYLERLTG